MTTATFPVEIEITYGRLFMPSLMKLQEWWERASIKDQNAFRRHFAKEGVDVDMMIAEPDKFNIVGEIPYRPLPWMENRVKTQPVHSYCHEQAEMSHRIQRDLK